MSRSVAALEEDITLSDSDLVVVRAAPPRLTPPPAPVRKRRSSVIPTAASVTQTSRMVPPPPVVGGATGRSLRSGIPSTAHEPTPSSAIRMRPILHSDYGAETQTAVSDLATQLAKLEKLA